MARLLMRGALKTLGADERLEMFCAESFSVGTRRRVVDVVVDGEVVRCHAPLEFHVMRNALQVMCPVPEASP